MTEGFTQTFQVRFDECGPDGAARASVILRHVIETAFSHSAAEGYPLSWYEEHGLFWLVRRARLNLPRPIPYGATLAVTTRVVGFRRIWARRQNEIREPNGELLGEATMDWIFTDREGNPARVIRQMEAAFPGLQHNLEVVRLEMPDPPPDRPSSEYRVPAHQIDPRGHMNSAAYLDLFDDELAGAGGDPQKRPALYELEYLRAAGPGETLRTTLWHESGGWLLRVTSAAGLVARGRRSRPGSQ